MRVTFIGAVAGTAFALIGLQSGVLAAGFVFIAAAIGAAVAGSTIDELHLRRILRELQDRS